MMVGSLNIVIPATPSAIHPVADEVMHLLEYHLWPHEERVKVELALREALANGIQHGCQGDPTRHVQCCVSCDDDSGDVLIVVRDEGQGFELDAVPDPLEPSRLLRTSGRGVFLISRMMDEVSYVDGGRELQMRKRRVADTFGASVG